MQTTLATPTVYGTVSSGTLRDEDLIPALARELDGLVRRSGEFLGMAENRPVRDRFATLLGEANGAFDEDGELTGEMEEFAGELVGDLIDALNEFAPEGCYFGAHEGDGADFGWWACDDESDVDLDDPRA